VNPHAPGTADALLGLPRPTVVGLAPAFVLFRPFDIFKPGPVGWADRRGNRRGDLVGRAVAVARGVGVNERFFRTTDERRCGARLWWPIRVRLRFDSCRLGRCR
jgi:hypothetical protein